MASLPDFIRAVVDGDVDQVSLLLARDPALATTAAAEGATRQQSAAFYFADIAHYLYAGDTALHMAAAAAQAKTIEYLLSVGADPNAVDRSGVAPLHRAVRTRSLAAVRALLDGGAHPTRPNKSGSTPLRLAVLTTGRGGSGSARARDQQKAITALLRATGLLALLFAGASNAQAQDRVRGLLALPEVFGSGACDTFDPETIDLYTAPVDGTRIATIRVDQNWSFAPHGGCEGLKVSVHRDGRSIELPTLEYSYEQPAAIVLDEANGWFKIRLTGDTAWVRATVRDHFMPLGQLFSEFVSVTSLTDAASGPLLDAPGGAAAKDPAKLALNMPVRVVELRQRNGEIWLHIAVMSHSICDSERGPPDVVQLGWLPAHSATGEPTVWFASRGC